MDFSITFLECDYEKLTAHLFSDISVEQAAFLLCNQVDADRETRFLVKRVILITTEQLLYQTIEGLSIPSNLVMAVLKEAATQKQSFFLVHSHPGGVLAFSPQDNRIEPDLFTTALNRIRSGIHGSVVFITPQDTIGRVWLREGERLKTEPIKRIRSIGRRFLFFDADQSIGTRKTQVFDRNVLAFGQEMQNLLGRLKIGVVGCGGTGSAVIEQLIRLGVGEITVYDDDVVEETNITRIHGSTQKMIGKSKVDSVKKMADEIGLGTVVIPIFASIKYEEIAKTLRKFDIIFGCTDDNLGRAVLNQIALRYYLPVIDMGVKIDSKGQNIRKIVSRITVIHPGTACLLCRERIDMGKIALEMKSKDEIDKLVRDGYAPELDTRDPAVVAYTTHVASAAVSELLNKLTGLTYDSEASEFIYIFNERKLLKTSRGPTQDCFCGDSLVIGRGDNTRLFLDMMWPKVEEK